MHPSFRSPLRPAESGRRDPAPRLGARFALSLALASAVAGALPGTTACSRCDLYYYPVELILEPSPVQADLFAVAVAQDVALAVGDGGAIVRMWGGEWTTQASGTQAALRGVDFAGPEVAVAVGDGGTLLRSGDAGTTWTAVDAGVTADLAAVRCNEGGTCVTVGDDTLLVSADAGETWAPPMAAPPELGALRAVEIDARGFHSFIAVGLAGAVVVSEDGQTWTAVPGMGHDFYTVALVGSAWALGGAGGALFFLANDELLDESLFVTAAVTGIARDGEWLIRDDGSLAHGEPAWQDENVVNDDAGRPLHALAAVGDEVLVVGDGGLIGRGRVADEMECDHRWQ